MYGLKGTDSGLKGTVSWPTVVLLSSRILLNFCYITRPLIDILLLLLLLLLYGFICIRIIDIRKWYNVSSMCYMPWMSWIRILKCVSYVAIYMEIHGYICCLVNARIMKFIHNEIRIMFSRCLALLWFLIIKTFNLKYLVGERYKGCISQPLLSFIVVWLSTLPWRICLAPFRGCLIYGTTD